MKTCSRCDSVMFSTTGWNAILVEGVITGIICPRCQTPEENAEAEINDGCFEYSTDDDGLHRGSPKAGS